MFVRQPSFSGGGPLTGMSSCATPSNNNMNNNESAFFTDFGADETSNGETDVRWTKMPVCHNILRILSFVSLISVILNTPKTFENYPISFYITYGIDVISFMIFFAEMIDKIYDKGFYSGEKAYFKNVWCQFDSTMLLFNFLSVVIQSLNLSGLIPSYTPLSIIRAPRSLVMIRFIRGYLKFSMPKSRIILIFKRSSHQIYNVTLFFLFFMYLYGLLGVQFFGELNYHCVINGVKAEDVTVDDLAIPDLYCNPKNNSGGHQCPDGFDCINLDVLGKAKTGFTGFGEIATSVFTVYQAASQEGWVYIMYRAGDSVNNAKAWSYFMTMIFFIAWMVKNVFIAVITETFNEIRVQVQEIWGNRQQTQRHRGMEGGACKKHILIDANSTNNGNNTSRKNVLPSRIPSWRLVEVTRSKYTGLAPGYCRKFLQSGPYHVILIVVTLMNAFVTSSVMFKHTRDEKPREYFFQDQRLLEIYFTIFYNLEAVFKILCLSFRGYISSSLHKFEFMLAVMTTIHVLPIKGVFMSWISIFQVLRVIRLIKASKILEDFVYKIFGPGKKLGSLLVFTMCMLVIFSSISMHLFCCIPNLEKFETFPYAFISMFQILTQEAWPEVMSKTMERVDTRLTAIVAIYFILYHLFVTLIVMSLFVAVILDNLELDEEMKKVKQMKMREESSDIKEDLPLRLRIFEKFPERPLMTRISRTSSDFPTPKVRESFLAKFVYDADNRVDVHGLLSKASVTNKDALKSDQEVTFTNGKWRKYGIGNHEMLTLAKEIEDVQAHDLGTGYKKQTAPFLTHLPRKMRRFNSLSMKQVCISDLVDTSKRQTLNGSDNFAAKAGQQQTRTHSFLRNVSKSRNNRGVLGENSKSSSRLPLTKRRTNNRNVVPTLTATSTDGSTSKYTENGVETDRMYKSMDIKLIQAKRQQAELRRKQKEEDLRENHPFFDRPLFAVARESAFRKIVQRIVHAQYDPALRDAVTGKERKVNFRSMHKILSMVTYLDWMMLVITFITSISMMFETPTYRVMDNGILQIADYIFVIAMGIELTLKVLADGLFFTPRALVQDFGGVFDLFIFFISLGWLCWMPKIIPPNSLPQSLMLLRCFRPLRAFILMPHMRKAVKELFRGFKEIVLVAVLLLILIFIFASYGVHLFGMRFASCNDKTIKERKDCVGIFRTEVFVTKMNVPEKPGVPRPGFFAPRVWMNPRRFNFDTLSNSMLALFEVLSFKGWVDLRDVIIYKMGPTYSIYIHMYVFLGSMIGLTLFVGVVIANYRGNKGTALLTVDQMRWSDLKKRLKIVQPLHIPPKPENSRYRSFIYNIVQHLYFKRLVAGLVLLNSTLLSVKWEQDVESTALQPQAVVRVQGNHTIEDDYQQLIETTSSSYQQWSRRTILSSASSVLIAFFVLEVVMKVIAYTPYGYWQSLRNRADLLVTVVGCVWIAADYLWYNEYTLTYGYVVIILRFFTITGKHATLKMLMQTVLVSMCKSFFIILGMFLLIQCYAFVGVILFGSVKFGEAINRQANFQTAVNGIVMLFRIVTGEDWNRVLHDCMLSPPSCTSSLNSYSRNISFWETDCGNAPVAVLYFCSFYVMITYIVLNLLVAIIMENFSLFYSNDEDALLSYADIRNFQNTWNMVDINQRGMIPVKRVKFILRLLKGRLEVDTEKDRLLFKHMCYELEKVHNSEDVTFHDVLNMLSYRSVDIRKSLQLEELLAREELEYAVEEDVAKMTIRKWLDGCLKRIRERESSLMAGLRALNEEEIAKYENVENNLTTAAVSNLKTLKEEDAVEMLYNEDTKVNIEIDDINSSNSNNMREGDDEAMQDSDNSDDHHSTHDDKMLGASLFLKQRRRCKSMRYNYYYNFQTPTSNSVVGVGDERTTGRNVMKTGTTAPINHHMSTQRSFDSTSPISLSIAASSRSNVPTSISEQHDDLIRQFEDVDRDENDLLTESTRQKCSRRRKRTISSKEDQNVDTEQQVQPLKKDITYVDNLWSGFLDKHRLNRHPSISGVHGNDSFDYYDFYDDSLDES